MAAYVQGCDSYAATSLFDICRYGLITLHFTIIAIIAFLDTAAMDHMIVEIGSLHNTRAGILMLCL